MEEKGPGRGQIKMKKKSKTFDRKRMKMTKSRLTYPCMLPIKALSLKN